MTTMKLNHNYILVRPGHHCCVLRQSPDRCCDQEIQLHVINLLLNWLQLTCHDQWSEVFALKIGNDQMWLIVSLISWTWDHVSQACVIHSLCPVKDSIFVVSAPGICLLRSFQTTPAPWWLFVVWAGAHQSHSWRQSSHKILASVPHCSSLHWQYNICLRLTHSSIPEHDNVVTHWAEAAKFQPINPFPVWVCCHVVQFTTMLLPTATRASVVLNIPV